MVSAASCGATVTGGAPLGRLARTSQHLRFEGLPIPLVSRSGAASPPSRRQRIPASGKWETRRITIEPEVVIVTSPGAQILDVTGPLEAFSSASRFLPGVGY